MRALVTGASGFVGEALCRHLRAGGHTVVPAGRDVIGDIGADPPWDKLLPGVDTVLHLAALVHQMGEAPPFDAYRRINVKGTEQLARACVRQRVRRVVFLSSVKVNGECSGTRPFTAEDEPRPEDDYGRSKLEAEQAIASLADTGSLEAVVVRPPLVYGPGVRANFRRLLSVAARLNPLVVPAISAKRSFVGLDNLVGFLSLCATHQAAAGQTFLVSDGEDVSASELVTRMARIMGHRTFRLPAADGMLRLAARLLGKQEEIRRILDPLTVSPEKAARLLFWSPPVSLDNGLRATVEWFMSKDRLP